MAKPNTDRGESATHRVVCVEQVEGHRGEYHLHVAALETREGDGTGRRWGLVDIVTAMRHGDRFLAGTEARDGPQFEPMVCPSCGVVTLAIPHGAVVPDCAAYARGGWRPPQAH